MKMNIFGFIIKTITLFKSAYIALQYTVLNDDWVFKNNKYQRMSKTLSGNDEYIYHIIMTYKIVRSGAHI